MKGPDQQNLHMSTSGWLFFIIKCHLPVDHSLNVWIYLSASIVKCVEKRIKVQRTIKMIKYLGRMLYWFVMFTLKRKRLRSGYLNALKLISSWFRKKKKKKEGRGKKGERCVPFHSVFRNRNFWIYSTFPSFISFLTACLEWRHNTILSFLSSHGRFSNHYCKDLLYL